jgi:hypothetical protein
MELKPGQLVCYRGIWHGMILDIFKSEYSQTILLSIRFVKNVYKRQKCDVIEYEPEALTTTTLEAIQDQIEYNERQKESELASFSYATNLSLADKGE